MMQRTRFVCLLLAAILAISAFGLFTPDSSGVNVHSQLAMLSDMEPASGGSEPTFYEIFVYSFCDSDGDGIGDLRGVISKLDYLQELGIGGIWLMPIHPADSYHKYDVADYYGIDPQYGTMEDFDALMAECEKRNIPVILDLVLNHTALSHPWFQEAKQYLESLEPGQEPDSADCPYVDYYHFSTEQPNNTFYPLAGDQWYYEGKFWSGMPDLNLECPGLRSEIQKIMAFWMGKGVSGFRLDAAKEFYSGNAGKNVEVLRFLMDTARKINPDAYLVAEVWENYQTIAQYYESGIPSLFDFAFADSNGKITSVIRGVDNEKTVRSFATAQEKAYAAYASGNPDFINAPFLSNHDTGRIAGFCNRDENKMKLAGAMNLMMSGRAFVYYGEELGMIGSGNDPSKRAPMLWNLEGTDGVTDPPPECELPAQYPLGSLAQQQEDAHSIYQYYRSAIALRNRIPAISRGVPTAEVALNQGTISATRKTWGGECAIVLMNIGTQESSCDLRDYASYTLAGTLTVDEAPVTLENNTLTLPPYAVAVLTM